jgi:hypothetical protein
MQSRRPLGDKDAGLRHVEIGSKTYIGNGGLDVCFWRTAETDIRSVTNEGREDPFSTMRHEFEAIKYVALKITIQHQSAGQSVKKMESQMVRSRGNRPFSLKYLLFYMIF